MEKFEENIANVIKRVHAAAERSGRPADTITLIAVSKTQTIDAIQTAYKYGVREFGENRSKELEEKATQLSSLPDIKWNFIGSLQTKQAGPVAECGHVFHAVDRVEIATTLSRKLDKYGKELKVYIQVNVSGEETKSGFDCSAWETNVDQRDTLLNSIEVIGKLPNLEIQGLMTMAPISASASPDTIRNIFRRTKNLSDWVRTVYSANQFQKLSMGMSGDFEIAIEEGATCVRVGSAIFK